MSGCDNEIQFVKNCLGAFILSWSVLHSKRAFRNGIPKKYLDYQNWTLYNCHNENHNKYSWWKVCAFSSFFLILRSRMCDFQNCILFSKNSHRNTHEYVSKSWQKWTLHLKSFIALCGLIALVDISENVWCNNVTQTHISFIMHTKTNKKYSTNVKF